MNRATTPPTTILLLHDFERIRKSSKFRPSKRRMTTTNDDEPRVGNWTLAGFSRRPFFVLFWKRGEGGGGNPSRTKHTLANPRVHNFSNRDGDVYSFLDRSSNERPNLYNDGVRKSLVCGRGRKVAIGSCQFLPYLLSVSLSLSFYFHKI